MSAVRTRRDAASVDTFLLHHRHEPDECGAVFASFKGTRSPLRHGTVLASCVDGGHAIWWTVAAADAEAALALLPNFVSERTDATRVAEVEIP